MSIREVQIRRVLEDTVRLLYSGGTKPTLNEIFSEVSQYFSEFPAGLPLPVDLSFTDADGRSNADSFNQLMARTIANLHML